MNVLFTACTFTSVEKGLGNWPVGGWKLAHVYQSMLAIEVLGYFYGGKMSPSLGELNS